MKNSKKIAVVGAGPSGIEAASLLACRGFEVTVFEKCASPLTNLADKALLFPNFQPAAEVVSELSGKLGMEGIKLMTGSEVVSVEETAGKWRVVTAAGESSGFDALLLATGYKPFDARRKEELGYGIYSGVITSLELEKMIREGRVVNSRGETPARVSFLQCVGSRDEKSGNHYCSKVCCVTAVKQAIEVRKMVPASEVHLFYMDLRMWGQGFEEMYRTAQEKYGVNFIRGRISEAAQTFDGRVQLKSEDTLLGLPLKMTTDLLVLMVGMEPSEGSVKLGGKCGVCGEYGFIQSVNPHLKDNLTSRPGLFVCGACKRPMSVQDSINDGRSAAFAVEAALS